MKFNVHSCWRDTAIPWVLCLLLLLGGSAVLLTGCAVNPTASHPSGAAGERVFRVNLGTEPPDLDPARMTDLTSFGVILPLMKGLTQFDAGMKVVPAMAESWTRSPDGLRYTFHLRPNARWSDGTPVSAEDFLYAWERALNPAMGAEYAFFLFEIKNAKAYNSGALKDFLQVGAQAPDARTLTVQLERPTPFFPDLMAAPIALPLRRDVVEKYGDRFTEAGNFVSNGAYQMAQWAHDEKIVLRPNPRFYGPRPKVDAIEMVMVNDANTSVVMYENNELDFIETTTSLPAFDVRRLRHSPDYHAGILHRINYFGFNTKKPPFNNPKVRQAFGLALDRSYFPRLLQSGQKPIASFITPGLVGYNPKLGLHYHPQKAKQLLAEAGYPDGKGFPTVTLAFRTMYDIQKEAEIAQYLWRKNLNVQVRLENMEWKVFLGRLADDPPHIFRSGWFIDYPDADSYMTLFISDGGNNYTGWKSPRYDALVQQAALSLNPAVRQKLYDEAQHLLLEDAAAIIPIYAAEKAYLVKPHIKGLVINALNLPNYDSLEVLPR